MKLKMQNINSTAAGLLSDRDNYDYLTKEDEKNTSIKKVRHSISRRPALYTFLILICGIFVGEMLVDSLIRVLHPYSIFVTTIIDSALLIASVFPLLYFLVFRPFRTHIRERLQSEKEIKLKNEELKKLNSEKDKFFSILAHDLRGPLGAFMELTEMLADDSQDLTPDQKKDLSLDMNHSARNIFNLLENLLEWSKMQGGLNKFKPRLIGLIEEVNESTKIFIESVRNKAIELAVDIPIEQKVFADANMIKTVIRNLVSNAIKFTPKGGKITISATHEENNTSVIAVKDSGIGMTNAMVYNLFRLDSKSGRRGTEGESSNGLGLLLCKEFIEKHGGRIWVESEEGKGSVFYFTIPYHANQKEKNPARNVVAKVAKEKRVKNLKILIVEDDKISEKFLAIAVKKFSKEVLYVKNGAEAIEACRNHIDIDLVLMDIQMPGMDGFETTRQIRQFNNDVIIIAETALVLSDDSRIMALEAGCNDYLPKPIDKSLLTTLINKYF
jgi:signal transduction histidine kinase